MRFLFKYLNWNDFLITLFITMFKFSGHLFDVELNM